MGLSDILGVVFGIIGGLGLFLYGMSLLSSGLQKSSADTLKKVLEKLTTNRVTGTIVGTVVTMAIQSSSVTTVMVVGFVNAGLMNLTQALSVILGANVGTTITAQIIAFKITAIALPAIGIGALLLLFAKRPRYKYAGEMLLGFGLLFFGMDVMTQAFIPLSKAEWFTNVFLIFSQYPLLAVMAGMITTFIVQSSSATLGITMALATTGAIDFQAAAALVLGENIGTTVTANIAALNASRTAKQAALGHFLINAIGVTYIMIFLYPFLNLIEYITPNNANFLAADGTQPYISRHIANAHTIFNVINTFVFLPFIPLLAKLCEKIIRPEKLKDDKRIMVQLSDNMMSSPEIAVGFTQKEVSRMFKLSLDMLAVVKNRLNERGKRADDISIKDKTLDLNLFHKEIKTFIEKLQIRELSTQSETALIRTSHTVDEIYQIGLRSAKMCKLIKKTGSGADGFTDDAMKELNELYDLVFIFATDGYNSYNNKSQRAAKAENEDMIDMKRKEFKNNHIARLNSGLCTVEKGLLFVDMLNTLEKIGDNTYTITQLMLKNNTD